MNAAADQALFPRELAGWAVRGVLCAGPSAFWASLVGFQHPVEIAAMIAGTAAWIVVFAWFSSWKPMQATPAWERFVQSLKMAAWIKSATLPFAAIGLALEWTKLMTTWTCWLAFFEVPDFIGGMGSLLVVTRLAGQNEPDAIARLNSFGWTLATTLVQGALITLLVVLLAMGVLGWRRLWPRLRQLVPARLPG